MIIISDVRPKISTSPRAARASVSVPLPSGPNTESDHGEGRETKKNFKYPKS